MSLTEAQHVFAGVSEGGINDILRAFFTARPHYLKYGSAFFVPTTTTNATNVAAIAFPGVPTGIQYQIEFTIPIIDFFPDTNHGPIPPGPNQFDLQTVVTLTLACLHWESGGNRDQRPGSATPITTKLQVWARGGLVPHYFSPGNGYITFQIDTVEIVDIKPDTLESLMECLIRMILSAVLANVQLPIQPLSAGAFALILTRGPEINNDQVKLFGDV